VSAQTLNDRRQLIAAHAGLAGAVILSLWLRAVPAWRFVFTPWGVDFQEPDAWFHLRTAHNLLAHFPWRSGFDPYALFPGGMNMPTGPLWDYMIACAAWLAGLGSPSAALTDHIAAWLPAILGALYPIPVFWISRRLFSLSAAVFAAFWIAVAPGDFLWLTHLGNADHHAAEGLFAILVFCFLCAGTYGHARWLAALGGVSLGCLLAVQPGAVFVPGILVSAAMFAPSLAVPLFYVFGAAAVVMLPVGANPYSGYYWLALGAGIAAAASIWKWPGWQRWIVLPGAFALAFGIAWIARPSLMEPAVSGLRLLNTAPTEVGEMRPLIDAPATALHDLDYHLGLIWIAALPGLIWIVVRAFRHRRQAHILLALFSVAFTIAAFLHLRMILYLVPLAAILAGVVCASITRFAGDWRRRIVLGGVIAAIVFSFDINLSIQQMSSLNYGGGRDWLQALDWLRQHSPEPFGDGSHWTGYFPRLKAGQNSTLRPPAWGIAVWWDVGYMVEALSQRIPMVNGFGAGISERDAGERTLGMARFYSSTASGGAVDLLRRLQARYVVVDDRYAVVANTARPNLLPTVLSAAGLDPAAVYRPLWKEENGSLTRVYFFLEDYYRNIAVRLYLNDGDAIRGAGPWAVGTRKDAGGRDVITSLLHFDTKEAAVQYVEAHYEDNLAIGCPTATHSCFDVEAVSGLHRIFPERGEGSVKIFEVEPATPGGSQ
jgi:dolichyl-phosphooligosaccharide-protein glycotransferase